MRGATTRGVGGPSTEGGRGGLRTSGSCSFVFSTRHVLCRISVLLHHASISGAVRCVVWGEGCVGVRGCMGWYGRELSLCRDTVFNLAESPLRERFFPCTHGFPRCPPHADARSWARHRSVGKGCAGGVGGAVLSAPSAEAGGEAGEEKRMAHRRRRRPAPSRARGGLVVAIAIWKDLPERGRSSVEGGRARVDWRPLHPSPRPLPPAPPRVRFAEFRLVFLVSVGQEERSMSIVIPGRAPPLPTSHLPPPQHRSLRPVHGVAHAPSREASKHAGGWRSWP